MHILYIHGANATPKCFSYMAAYLPEHTGTYMSYDASDSLVSLIRHAVDLIDQPCHIVAHSMGGIIGLAASQVAGSRLVHTLTTISTPFGGSETADRLSLVLPFNQFVRNLKTTNPILNAIKKAGPVTPTLNIITTKGNNPFETRENDGIVTVASQVGLAGARQVVVPFTHFEVLMDRSVTQIVSDFMMESSPTVSFT